MPELPEVETIRRQLGDVLVGMMIEDVEVRSEKSLGGDVESLIGAEIVEVRRRGKGLIIDLEKKVKSKKDKEKPVQGNPLSQSYSGQGSTEPAKISMLIHLKMTGQLVFDRDRTVTEQVAYTTPATEVDLSRRIVGGHPTGDFVSRLPSKHTRVIIKVQSKENRVKSKGVLYFNDQRRFGWIKVIATEEVEEDPFIKKLGLEPWDLSEEDWKAFLISSRKAVKVRLLDQDKVAGVGNIYANDALWEAKIDPRRAANSLDESEMILLFDKVKQVLEEGVFYGGATLPDGNYVNMQGLGGGYQDHFRVYHREGEQCLREGCDGVIVKGKLGGRGTYWCEECQG